MASLFSILSMSLGIPLSLDFMIVKMEQGMPALPTPRVVGRHTRGKSCKNTLKMVKCSTRVKSLLDP